MYSEGIKIVGPKGDFNHTVKACMPALDAMTMGYIIPLPQDLSLAPEGDGKKGWIWPSDIFKQIDSHSPGQVSNLPIDSSVWDTNPLKFNNPWVIKTPPGYSTLFTHPFWRDDLPFRCFPGVVDTDTYNFNSVNFPFLIRKDFYGIISAGTPMIQVIPFKRVSFSSCVIKEADPAAEKKWQKAKTTFGHRYKLGFRQKKEYK